MNLGTDLIRVDRRAGAAGNRNLVAENTLVRTSGVGQEDGNDEGAFSGSRVLDTRCWILVIGCWMLDGGFSILVRGVDWFHWVD